MFLKRIGSLQSLLVKNKLDALLISNPYNIFYTTGFKGLSPEDREAFAFATQKKTYLITGKLYKPSYPNTLYFGPGKRLSYYILDIARKEKIKTIGIEGTDLKVSELEVLKKNLPTLTFTNTKNPIQELRAVKSNEEISAIRQACKISDECFTEMARVLKIGMTEREITLRIDRWMKDKGFDGAWYPPVVAVDQNAAVPHHDSRTSDVRIKKNSLLLIDMGAKYKEYVSDITRMFVFGTPTNEIRNIHEKLLDTQIKTIKFLKKGMTGETVDSYCRKLLEKDKLPSHPHVTGHGVGLEVHEDPHITINSQQLIQPGNAITVEPGVYFEGRFGMRIEDTILVTDSGTEILTKFPKKLRVL